MSDQEQPKINQNETKLVIKKYVEELVPYDISVIGHGKGFTNLTSTMCYHNSLMQCILSLPAVYKAILKTKFQHFLTNTLKRLWEVYYEFAENKNDELDQLNQKLWQAIIQISKQRSDLRQFDTGQQDASEGLLLFLSVIEKSVPDLYVRFEHMYSHVIYCVDCQAKKTVKKKGTIIHVKQSFKSNQHPMFASFRQPNTLNEYIISHDSHIEGYICEKCKSKKDKFSLYVIQGLPEILPILFEKYHDKTETKFPEELTFHSAIPGRMLVYRLVAQCEHSGGQGGGHYWAITQRSNGVVNLNDARVTPSVFTPTTNTYMIFYHYVGSREIIKLLQT